MANTWYGDYVARLDKYKTNATPPSNYASVAGVNLNGMDLPALESNGFMDHLKDAGGVVLDVLSRPGYAAGSFLNDILRDSVGQKNDVNPFQAGLEGLTGKRKEFFSPYEILDPYQEGESGGETAGRFVTDFLASVLTDPLTWVPGAAVAKGAKIAGDLTGATKGLDKVKSLLRPELAVDNVAAPSAAAAPAASTLEDAASKFAPPAESGNTAPVIPGADEIPVEQVNNGAINNAVGASPLAPVEASTVNPSLKMAPFTPDPKAQDLIASLLTGGRANAPGGLDLSNRLFALKSVRTGITDTMKNIRGRLFRDGEFQNPWRDVQVTKETRPEPVKPTWDTELVEPKAITSPRTGREVQDLLDKNVIVRSVIDAAAATGPKEEMLKLSKVKGNQKKIFYADDTDEVIKGGAAVSPYAIAEKYRGKPLSEFQKANPTATVGLIKDANGQTFNIPPTMYAKMLKGEFPLKDLEGMSIAKQGELHPAEDYFQSRREKWARGETTMEPTPEEIAKYQTEKAARDEATKAYEADYNAWKDEQLGLTSTQRIKPDKEARIAWIADHKDKLTEEDLKGLRNMMNLGNEAGFLKKIDAIMQRESNLDIEAIGALEEAVKSGRVPMDSAKELFDTFGVKTFSQAKKRLLAIDKEIERLQGKGATLENKTTPRNNINYAVAERYPAPTIPPLELTKFKSAVESPVGREQAKTVLKDAGIDADNLSPEIMDFTINSLKSVMETEFKNARKTMVHPRKAKGAKGDTKEVYAGGARYLEEYNMYSQMTHFKSLMGLVSKSVPKNAEGKGLVGYQRGKYMYDRVLPALKAHDTVLRTYGIQPSVIPGGKGIPLSMYDVLSALPEKWVIQHIFTLGNTKAKTLKESSGRQISVTQMLKVAEQALGIKPDDLKEIVDLTLRQGLDFGDNPLLNSAAGFAQAKGQAAFDRAAKKHGPDMTNSQQQSAFRQASSAQERIWNESLDPISNQEFIDSITAAVERNRASAGMQAETYVKKAEYAAVTKFIDDIANAKTQSEVFNLIDNARKGVPGFVKETTDIVPPPGAVEQIQNGVDLATSNFTTEMANKAVKEFDTAKTSDQLVKVETKIHDAIDDLVEPMLNDGTIPMVDLGNPAVYRQIRKWDVGPVAKAIAAYFPHLGEGKLRSVWLASNNSATFIANHFARSLSKLQPVLGTTADAKRIMGAIMRDEVLNSTDAAKAEELRKVLDQIFDTTGGNKGFLQRNGIEPAHVNSHLKHFGIDQSQFSLIGKSREDAYQSWKNWPDMEDPLDFLSKYFQAASRAYSERSFGSSISQRFGFAEHQPGMVKIQLTKGSRMAHLIDRDLWYPKEVAENMKAMDKTLFDAAQPPKNNAFGRIFDSLTHKYKTGLTIYRPGHHLRNMYGDVWLNYMDGVRSPKYYNQAHKVLATRKNYYDDPILDTRVGDLSFNGKGTAITMKTRGGQEVHLSYDDIYRLSVSQGILHDYSTIEDLGMLKDGLDSVSKGRSLTRPFNGKLHEKVAGVSEYRDHYVRMAHLMGLLDKDKNAFRLLKRLPGEHPEAQIRRSLELQFQDYSARIRKWHPDGSDLTLWEKRVMRRGVLFYSWIRKAVPLVIESMLTRPGRFLTFPKAMYEMAEANGIDLNGMGDPFPSDQLFPAWMGGIQGPQFGAPGRGYMGLRPGVPGIDILDNYLSSPGEGFKTTLTGLHPLFKVPVEMQMGKTMQGIPIKDTASYALGQVPFGNLANTTLGWLNGGDKPIGSTAPSNEAYDQLSNGFKDPAAIAWFNFLTGAGLIDMSKPSYQKAAEFDVKYGRVNQ